jgi:hypothetical protein
MVRFCNGVLSQKLLTHRVWWHCRGGESTYQARVQVFSSEQIPVSLSALPSNTVDVYTIILDNESSRMMKLHLCIKLYRKEKNW